VDWCYVIMLLHQLICVFWTLVFLHFTGSLSFLRCYNFPVFLHFLKFTAWFKTVLSTRAFILDVCTQCVTSATVVFSQQPTEHISSHMHNTFGDESLSPAVEQSYHPRPLTHAAETDSRNWRYRPKFDAIFRRQFFWFICP